MISSCIFSDINSKSDAKNCFIQFANPLSWSFRSYISNTASRHNVRAYSSALPPQCCSSYFSISARLSAVYSIIPYTTFLKAAHAESAEHNIYTYTKKNTFLIFCEHFDFLIAFLDYIIKLVNNSIATLDYTRKEFSIHYFDAYNVLASLVSLPYTAFNSSKAIVTFSGISTCTI